jgi:hypothetical protein
MDYPAVAFTSTTGGNCTGTLIAPRVILSAAHCVYGAQAGTVEFGYDVGMMGNQIIGMQTLFPHRFYDPGAIRNYDIALIRLNSAPTGIDPLPFNLDPLGAEQMGEPARVIGFGVTDGADPQPGGGIKRELPSIMISNVTEEHLVLGNDVQNICFGDSGGPTFLVLGGEERVVAVTSFTTGECDDDSYVTRTDVYGDDFLREVLAAWSGPCEHDGNCVMTGCGEFPDPDCDPCGLQGDCETGCPKVDLDCPAAGLTGDDCNDNEDCESRACIQAPDDPTVNFCAIRCAADDDSACKAPTTVCQQAADGEYYCVYADHTPGALGAPCEASEDCRSEICDRSAGVCANPCGEGEPECPAPYVCIDASDDLKICTKESGGGCGCSSLEPRDTWPVFLAFAVFLWRVRPRTARARTSRRK